MEAYRKEHWDFYIIAGTSHAMIFLIEGWQLMNAKISKFTMH